MIILFLFLEISSFSLKDINNKEVFIDSLLAKNKIVVISFWATWCKPCIKEIDFFNKLKNDLDSVCFVAINEDVNKEKVVSFVKSKKWDNILVVFDENQKIMKLLQVKAIPHSFIIGKDRKILYQKVGFKKRDEETLRKKITYFIEKN